MRQGVTEVLPWEAVHEPRLRGGLSPEGRSGSAPSWPSQGSSTPAGTWRPGDRAPQPRRELVLQLHASLRSRETPRPLWPAGRGLGENDTQHQVTRSVQGAFLQGPSGGEEQREAADSQGGP